MKTLLHCLLWLTMSASALVSAESPAHVSDCAPQGIALGGYDAVSYHQQSGPLMGKPGLAEEVDGLQYLFTSEANRATFNAAQEKYLPVYSGWCAATLAMGRLACPDYTNFKIENGRLLLFELAGFTNGRTLWNTDPSGFRQRADTNFEQLAP
ncbi:MAG: YHS domain-containing (seleno)protein [Pseudomonadota bacterium]